MVSVVIAAHNEEAVIGRCLDAIRLAAATQPVEVIVSANGCTDATAARAAEFGAIVIDRTEPGKAAALNAAEAIASEPARLYLDADIVAPPESIDRLVRVFVDHPGVHAVVPQRRLDTSASTWPVRSYYAINRRLPAFRRGLFGRGMILLSPEGRARFDDFPLVVADDLFLDSLFRDEEKAQADDVEVAVAAPLRTSDLVARLVRVRHGNAQLRRAAADGSINVEVREADRWAWLRAVVLPRPWLAVPAVVYVAITLIAARQARRSLTVDWGQDHSTRRPARSTPEET